MEVIWQNSLDIVAFSHADGYTHTHTHTHTHRLRYTISFLYFKFAVVESHLSLLWEQFLL